MDVRHVKDNPDGSADYLFDLSDEDADVMIQIGIETAIRNTIKHTRKPDAWLCGEEVFRYKDEAESYRRIFCHHEIIPLYV